MELLQGLRSMPVAITDDGLNVLAEAIKKKRIVILDVFLMSDADTVVELKGGDAVFIGPIPLLAGAGFHLGPFANGYFEAAKNTPITLTLTGAANVGGFILVQEVL